MFELKVAYGVGLGQKDLGMGWGLDKKCNNRDEIRSAWKMPNNKAEWLAGACSVDINCCRKSRSFEGSWNGEPLAGLMSMVLSQENTNYPPQLWATQLKFQSFSFLSMLFFERFDNNSVRDMQDEDLALWQVKPTKIASRH